MLHPCLHITSLQTASSAPPSSCLPLSAESDPEHCRREHGSPNFNRLTISRVPCKAEMDFVFGFSFLTMYFSSFPSCLSCLSFCLLLPLSFNEILLKKKKKKWTLPSYYFQLSWMHSLAGNSMSNLWESENWIWGMCFDKEKGIKKKSLLSSSPHTVDIMFSHFKMIFDFILSNKNSNLYFILDCRRG